MRTWMALPPPARRTFILVLWLFELLFVGIFGWIYEMSKPEPNHVLLLSAEGKMKKNPAASRGLCNRQAEAVVLPYRLAFLFLFSILY